MDVKDANAAWLSNYEVMVHLQKLKDRKLSQSGQLATITYETLKYLDSSGCSGQQPDNIAKCIQAINKYELKKSEKLMIVNNPPTSALEIQLIIDKSEQRLSDIEVSEILEVVRTYLIPEVKEDSSD